MGQVFLVRHGQASFGSSNYDQLSARGVEQAGVLGDWFAQRSLQVDRVVTGTMLRHRQTAQSCIGRLPGAPIADDWISDGGFNEYDHDEVLHRHRPEFAQPGEVRRFLAEATDANRTFQRIFQEAMGRWMSGRHDQDYTEPWPVFRGRCVAALQRLIEQAGASQTTLVFTSGGTIATLCQHLLGIPDAHVFTLNWTLVNTGVTKLYYRGAGLALGSPALSLGYLNNYAHLESLGDRHAITYR